MGGLFRGVVEVCKARIGVLGYALVSIKNCGRFGRIMVSYAQSHTIHDVVEVHFFFLPHAGWMSFRMTRGLLWYTLKVVPTSTSKARIPYARIGDEISPK